MSKELDNNSKYYKRGKNGSSRAEATRSKHLKTWRRKLLSIFALCGNTNPLNIETQGCLISVDREFNIPEFSESKKKEAKTLQNLIFKMKNPTP